MNIHVVVKSNARKESVEVRADGSLFVCVNAPPTEGKANQKVVELLAVFFKRPKRAVTIRRGLRSKNKLVEIL